MLVLRTLVHRSHGLSVAFSSPALMSTPGTQTNASPEDVFAALIDAGAPPGGVLMIAAQSALETHGWQGGMWGWNLGNITTTADDPNAITLPGNSLLFKSYASLQDGANDFVHYLDSHNLLSLSTGSLDAYVAQLQAIGYAGNADYSQYQAGMQRWMNQLQGTVPSVPGLVGGAFDAGSVWPMIFLVVAVGGVVWLWHDGYFDDAWANLKRGARRLAPA